ncbi:MAG: hypothetical protein V1912_01730 [bacterium]
MSAQATDAAVGDRHHMHSGRVWGRVVGNEPLGSLVWLTIDVPGWRSARPGQFALLQSEPSRCFLARALSIADEVGERVSFLIAPVGEGTRELCGLEPGARVWVLGPLGNGFDMEEIACCAASSSPSLSAPSSGLPRLLIVAGGVGAAPFPFLLSRLVDRYALDRSSGTAAGAPAERFPEVVVLAGFRDASQARGAAPVIEAVCRLREAGSSSRFVMAAEDGSCGPAEKVTDLLARELRPGDRLVACGPSAMSVAVWSTCCQVADVQAWFSLEAGMACGVGSCHGCALTLADGSMVRVCRDGPVFFGARAFGPNMSLPVSSDGGEDRA